MRKQERSCTTVLWEDDELARDKLIALPLLPLILQFSFAAFAAVTTQVQTVKSRHTHSELSKNTRWRRTKTRQLTYNTRADVEVQRQRLRLKHANPREVLLVVWDLFSFLTILDKRLCFRSVWRFFRLVLEPGHFCSESGKRNLSWKKSWISVTEMLVKSQKLLAKVLCKSVRQTFHVTGWYTLCYNAVCDLVKKGCQIIFSGLGEIVWNACVRVLTAAILIPAATEQLIYFLVACGFLWQIPCGFLWKIRFGNSWYRDLRHCDDLFHLGLSVSTRIKKGMDRISKFTPWAPPITHF